MRLAFVLGNLFYLSTRVTKGKATNESGSGQEQIFSQQLYAPIDDGKIGTGTG